MTPTSNRAERTSPAARNSVSASRGDLKKPKILILDDSTSAVDTKTDALIRQAFKHELPDTTKIIIAQRVSSVQDADRILVMDGGRIVESGTHEELLALNGIYREVNDSPDKEQGGMIMEKQNRKNGTFGRLLRYIYKNYRVYMITVIICIIIAAAASVVQTVFLQRLIDTCILPGLENGFESIRQPFMQTILSMVTLYVFGVAAAFTYTHLMATVTQGTLKHLRVDMFDKMQSLPIKYFDTHAHGDIMSTYTNDTDAIRQLIGQSLPMVFQSSLTITVMFLMMIYYSVWMTIIVCLFSALMLTVTKKFGGASSRYMMAQQKSLAREEGFIEEMIQGQKVVKVFCHEEECKKDFDKLNEQLFSDGEMANRYGNSLMPILNNVGNLMYVVLAIVGGLLVYLKAPNLSLSGSGVVTIGVIVSFLGMARQLSQTIGQASMQVSMIAMGLAGASRVFALIDEEPEEDEGYVTLVRAEWGADGVLKETNDKSGIWAWKHPHKADGTVTYTPLKGDIRLEDVDFGYTPEKLVLHDITLYAKPGQKIAFVGATGAGKTTITNLINRFL